MTRLRELRQARGWTISQLGEKVGLSGGFLSQIERGVWPPGAASAKRIADLFGFKPEELFPTCSKDEPDDVIERPKFGNYVCSFCGERRVRVPMLYVANSKKYTGLEFCSEACLEARIRTDPCLNGTCECHKHRPE